MDRKEIDRRVRDLLQRISGQPLFTFLPRDEDLGKNPFLLAPVLLDYSNKDCYFQGLSDAQHFAEVVVSYSTYEICSRLRLPPRIAMRKLVDHLYGIIQAGLHMRVRLDRTLALFEEGGTGLLIVCLLSFGEETEFLSLLRKLKYQHHFREGGILEDVAGCA